MYYRNRYYHTGLGRFINRDPIGYEGSKWNLYEYAGSKPIRFTDPDGTTFGLGVAMETCEKAEEDVKKDMAAEIAVMKAKGCSTPKVNCSACCEKGVGGSFDSKTNTVVVCALNIYLANANNPKGCGQQMEEDMKHEYIHAYNECVRGSSDTTGSERICDELLASSGSGECDDGGVHRLPDETREECIKRRAKRSAVATLIIPNPGTRVTPQMIEAAINQMYDQCTVSADATLPGIWPITRPKSTR